MHQRSVRWPARARALCGAQCVLPSVRCPVLPSVGCPVPSQGSLLDPRSRAQKGRLVRKRPGQARPQGSRTSQGSGRATFHSSFFIQHLSSFPAFDSTPEILFPFPKPFKETGQGPLSRDGGLSFHRTVPALEMLPAPDIEQILETLPLFSDRPKNNGGQRDGWSAATWT